MFGSNKPAYNKPNPTAMKPNKPNKPPITGGPFPQYPKPPVTGGPFPQYPNTPGQPVNRPPMVKPMGKSSKNQQSLDAIKRRLQG